MNLGSRKFSPHTLTVRTTMSTLFVLFLLPVTAFSRENGNRVWQAIESCAVVASRVLESRTPEQVDPYQAVRCSGGRGIIARSLWRTTSDRSRLVKVRRALLGELSMEVLDESFAIARSDQVANRGRAAMCLLTQSFMGICTNPTEGATDGGWSSSGESHQPSVSVALRAHAKELIKRLVTESTSAEIRETAKRILDADAVVVPVKKPS